MDQKEEFGAGTLMTKTDQQQRSVVIMQLQTMLIVPRPSGEAVHPCFSGILAVGVEEFVCISDQLASPGQIAFQI